MLRVRQCIVNGSLSMTILCSEPIDWFPRRTTTRSMAMGECRKIPPRPPIPIPPTNWRQNIRRHCETRVNAKWPTSCGPWTYLGVSGYHARRVLGCRWVCDCNAFGAIEIGWCRVATDVTGYVATTTRQDLNGRVEGKNSKRGRIESLCVSMDHLGLKRLLMFMVVLLREAIMNVDGLGMISHVRELWS